MGRMAEVSARRDGFVPVREMVDSLSVGAYAAVPDDVVLHQAGWTLFTFDFVTSEAVFTDTGGTDLAAQPFAYQSQYRTARRLLRLPFASLGGLAAQVPKPAPILQVFNMGHCGSTLLHHVFNASGSVWCVSEPLFTFELAVRRDELGPDRLGELMRAGMAFVRLYPGADAHGQIAVKHFSQATTIIGACHKAEPAPHHLFLYRGGERWCNSLYGFVQRLGGTLELAPERREFMWGMMSGATPRSRLADIVDMTADSVTIDQLAAVAWALHIGACRAAVAEGVPLVPVRYEDLVQDRQGTLTAAFAACGLGTAGVGRALAAFARDSHEGTATAKSVPVEPLPPEAAERIRAVLGHPSLGLTGDEIL